MSPIYRQLKRLARDRLPEPGAAALVAVASAYQDLRGSASNEPELAFVPWLCDDQEHSIDIGAYHGAYAFAMAKASKAVTCVEPNPTLARALALKFKLLRASHVTVLNAAASDVARTVELIVPNGVTGLASLEELYQEGPASTRIRIPAYRIDDIAPNDVGFIKIDVEGHEAKVIVGALATLARCRPNLLIEAEERHARGAVATIRTLLGRFGYNGFYFHEGSLHPIERFDPATMQNSTSLDATGTAKRPGATYINNFLFTARSQTARQVALLSVD